jgi:hypothetical protein
MADMVSMAGRVQRDAMGGEIISRTLDAVNNTGFGALSKLSVGLSNHADYAFQTSVLNAAYSGRGAFVDIMI